MNKTCEHAFGDGAGESSHAVQAAIERRNLWGAEDAARELPRLTLEEARQLVELYSERESPKYEKAAMRWLARYLEEADEPSLERFARLASALARGVKE